MNTDSLQFEYKQHRRVYVACVTLLHSAYSHLGKPKSSQTGFFGILKRLLHDGTPPYGTKAASNGH